MEIIIYIESIHRICKKTAATERLHSVAAVLNFAAEKYSTWLSVMYDTWRSLRKSDFLPDSLENIQEFLDILQEHGIILRSFQKLPTARFFDSIFPSSSSRS